MSSKEQKKVVITDPLHRTTTQWASGRGGAGNIHKAQAKKPPVDVSIPKQRKMLEVETARNRKTTTGRGGTGNKFHHVLEEGVFQRVISYEASRIVAIKTEETANKECREKERKRSKSTTPYDSSPARPVHHIRSPLCLRSASTSTFATLVTSDSGSSAASPSSYYPPSASTTSFSLSTAASRLFSPFKSKKRGGGISEPDASCVYSSDNASAHTIITLENPYRQRERPDSVDAMSASSSSTSTLSPIGPTRCGAASPLGIVPPNSSNSSNANTKPLPPRPNGSESRTRTGQEWRRGMMLKGERERDLIDLYGIGPRSFTQSGTNVSVDGDSRYVGNIRRAQPFLVEEERDGAKASRSRLADAGPHPRIAQAPPVAYHLPPRPIAGHQDKVIPVTRRRDEVLFF